MDKKIDEIVNLILEIDFDVLENINKRIRLVQRVKKLKNKEVHPFSDPGLDERVITALKQYNKGPLPDNLLEELWSHILTFSKVVSEGRDLSHSGSLIKEE